MVAPPGGRPVIGARRSDGSGGAPGGLAGASRVGPTRARSRGFADPAESALPLGRFAFACVGFDALGGPRCAPQSGERRRSYTDAA